MPLHLQSTTAAVNFHLNRLSTKLWELTPRLVSLLILAGLLMAGCSLASEPIPAGPVQSGPLPGEAPDVPVGLPSAARGGLIYLERCADCHGVKGLGDGAFAAELVAQGAEFPNLSDPSLTRQRSPLDWYLLITNGTMQGGGFMPPWRDALSEADRWDVTYYLYSLSTSPEIIAHGAELYGSHCAECHGNHGELRGLADPPLMSGLSAQDVFDLVTRGGDEMPALGDELSEDARWAVSEFAHTLAYDASLSGVTLGAAELPDNGEDATAEETEELPSSEEPPPIEEDAPLEPPHETNVVSGQVTNGTPGASIPAGLEIQLRGLTVDGIGNIVEFLSRTSTTLDDGSFLFADVPMDQPQSAYVVSIVYNGVEFTSGALVNAEQPVLELPLTIYEHTTDASVITLDAMHILVRYHPDSLLVVQILVFNNSSNRVYVSDEPVSGGRRGSVHFQLPPEAFNIQFEDGEVGGRFVKVGEEIYDTVQVLPGDNSHSIVATYLLPHEGGSSEITLPLPYDTRRVTLLAQEGGRVRTPLLSEAGIEVVEGTAYEKFIGADLPAGETLAIRLRGAPGAGGGSPLLPILGTLLGVLVVSAGVYWFVQGRGSNQLQHLSSEARAVAQQIADLDEAFEAGHVKRLDYEARRADLKADLADLMQGNGER